MAHALAAHARQRHLDRALLADDALVLHALVLAAQALIVLDRAKDARAEQTVAFRLEGAIVDGLRLFDLAVRPGQNLLRAGDRNPDLIEDLSRRLRAEKIHNLLVHRLLRLPTVSAAVVLPSRSLWLVMPGLDPGIHGASSPHGLPGHLARNGAARLLPGNDAFRAATRPPRAVRRRAVA